MVVSPLAGGEVPLGEGEEQGGPAGLHLGDLLLLPNHHGHHGHRGCHGRIPPVPHNFPGLVHLFLLLGRNTSLCQVFVHQL